MFSIGWSYIVIIGYEKQKCKRQLGLASLGQLSRSMIAFAGQLRLCPIARREQERKQNAVDSEKRSVGDGYLTFASVSEMLCSQWGDPAFLAAFHIPDKYCISQSCLLNWPLCSVIQSFPRDIFLPFFHNNFLELVHLGILDMDINSNTSSTVWVRLWA